TPAGACAVAGIGMNVTAAPDGAASLAGSGATVDGVLDALLARLARRYHAWTADPDAPDLAQAYRAACVTIGRDVRADLPGADPLTGRAVDIDGDGRLVIATSTGERAVGAGEIIHLRPNDR
ncbi:MAG TPA: biotin--[acetyl-CoA-carboxylase] ligase, partial [Micromonosporaceae bacterium]|nr:biotin--[acetyl-CoA-carboxylase] ligase [Micromonosporaceae bacterium]